VDNPDKIATVALGDLAMIPKVQRLNTFTMIFAIFFILGIGWNNPPLPNPTLIPTQLTVSPYPAHLLSLSGSTLISIRLIAYSYPVHRLSLSGLLFIPTRLKVYPYPAHRLFLSGSSFIPIRLIVYPAPAQRLLLPNHQNPPPVGHPPPIVSPPIFDLIVCLI